MTRHSKNNTSSSVFTYAEKAKLEYGTIEKRHTRDTVKDYDSCYLCFQPASNPVCCDEGHISCKECILSTMVSQRLSYRRQESTNKAIEKKNQELKSEAARSALLRQEEEFIRAVDGLNDRKKIKNALLDQRSSKRIELNYPETLKKIENVKKTYIPHTTLCHASIKTHPISLHSLVALNFIINETPLGEKEKICPICLKALSNSIQLLAFKKCGDIICENCVLLQPDKKCPYCGKESDTIIKVSKSGTGFASGGGQVSIKKYELPFQ